MKLFEQQNKVVPFLQMVDLFYHRGLLAYKKGNFQKAIFFMEKALKWKKDDPVFYCQLAAVYTEVANYRRSNELLYQVIEQINPDMYECYYFLANNYAYLGMFDKALEMAFHYLENCPDGEFAEDCEQLISFLQYDEDDLDEWPDEIFDEEVLIVQHDQVDDCLAEGKYELSMQQFENMIRKHPTQWSVYNYKAEAFYFIGEIEEAISITLEVLEKEPGNLRALCNLALFYQRQNSTDKSEAIVEQLKTVVPFDLDQRFHLAETFARLEQFQLAYSHLSALKKKDYRGDHRFYHCLAVCSFHCGRTYQALDYWKRLRDIGDNLAKEMLVLYHNHGLTPNRVKYILL